MPYELISGLPVWARPLGPGLAAALLTVAVTPLVIRLARRMGWVAEPREDRWHERPTALMGGIAIWAGTLAGWALVPSASWPWALATGGTLLFLSGLADDLNGLSPVAKVVAQVAGATVILVAGWELVPGWPAWLSVPLTYLWVIGITNAVNLLDNMDGLATGVAGIAAATVAVLAAVAGAWPEAGPALAVAGAAGGFLVFNFHPARIFMGDGGSLFLGFAVASLAMGQPGAGASGTAVVLAVPVAVMAVPILDTTLVTVKRIVTGRPVTQGGKDHSSHRLVFLGLSEERAVLTLYGVAAGFSALAVALQLFDVYLTLAVAAIALVALAVFGIFLGQLRVESDTLRTMVPGADAEGSDTEDEPAVDQPGATTDSSDGVALRAALRNKREIAVLVADLLLIVGAFVVAHYLRFETGLPEGHLDRMVDLLPVVVAVKLGALYVFGAYRGLLRYVGTHELIRVAKASTVASGLIVVGLVVAFRFEGSSRSVFVIDWLLATFAFIALRGAFRGLRGYFVARREGGVGKRVLLYGAGDAGYLALREIRQNPDFDLQPVGFVDDDPDKQSAVAHGLPVVGTGADLDRLVDQQDIQLVLVTIAEIEDRQRRKIINKCKEAGVPYQALRIDFVDIDESSHARRPTVEETKQIENFE